MVFVEDDSLDFRVGAGYGLKGKGGFFGVKILVLGDGAGGLFFIEGKAGAFSFVFLFGKWVFIEEEEGGRGLFVFGDHFVI